MPRNRDRCKDCGAEASEAVYISARQLCPDCAEARIRAQYERARNPDADWWRSWRTGVAAAIGIDLEAQQDPRP